MYRLRPSAETLLWLQAGLVTLSVLPLYLLSTRWLGQRMAICVSLAFLSLAPLQNALISGFSWLSAFCLFSFTLYYAVIAERHWLSALSLPCCLGQHRSRANRRVCVRGVRDRVVQEDTARGLHVRPFGVGICGQHSARAARSGYYASRPAVRAGLTTLFSNPVYFVLDLARAAKLAAMLHVLAPLALLPILSLASLPLLLPGLLFTSRRASFGLRQRRLRNIACSGSRAACSRYCSRSIACSRAQPTAAIRGQCRRAQLRSGQP